MVRTMHIRLVLEYTKGHVHVELFALNMLCVLFRYFSRLLIGCNSVTVNLKKYIAFILACSFFFSILFQNKNASKIANKPKYILTTVNI